MQDDNPLHREHWLGTFDPRPLALVRVALGATLLFDLIDRAPDVPDWFSARGVLPLSSLKGPTFSIFALSDRPEVVMVLFGAGVLATTAFLLGYRTRLATAATWLFFFSLYRRDSLCDDGADAIARVILFFGMFADLGDDWSLDRRAGRASGGGVQALPVRLMQLVLAVFYLAVARNKIRGGWPDGDVLYRLLQIEGFTRPPATWLLAQPSLCTALNHATWILELAIPVLAFLPWRVKWARVGCLCVWLAVQLGIAIGLKPGIHQLVMLAAALLWVPPGWLRRWDTVPTNSRRTPPLLLALASVQAALCIGVALAAGRLPAWTGHEVDALGLKLPTDLFSRPLPAVRWTAPGTLADGTAVDVLPIARPELQSSSHWFSTRWFKFTYREDAIHWPEIGRYLCRRWANRTAGHPRLRGFTLLRETWDPAGPGLARGPRRTAALLQQTCD